MFAPVSELQMWALLSAPACTVFALQSADGARFPHLPDTSFRLGAFARWSAAFFVLVVAFLQSSAADALGAAVFLSALAYLAAIDLRYLAAPVLETFIFLLLGLAFAWVVDGAEGLAHHGGAAVLAWLAFRALDIAYAALRGRSGLGAGDALIAAVIGAWQSYEGVAWATAIGSVAVLIWARVSRWPRDRPLPLAPGLAFGAAKTMLIEGMVRGWT
jgi:leader peptidase (prepilin peptidase)/N-methyltransferase